MLTSVPEICKTVGMFGCQWCWSMDVRFYTSTNGVFCQCEECKVLIWRPTLEEAVKVWNLFPRQQIEKNKEFMKRFDDGKEI